MNGKAKYLIFCMIFVGGSAFCQKNTSFFPCKILPGYTNKQAITDPAIMIKQSIKPDYYVTQLGFFCKQEIKFEKATRIPFKFRLGSVQYCDRMEGKNNLNNKQ